MRKTIYYDDVDYDDDLPLSGILSRMSNLGTWSTGVVTMIFLLRRGILLLQDQLRGNLITADSLQSSVKKSKFILYVNQVKDT